MCEFLLRVHDKCSEDPKKDVRCMKRGDVVVVCPDDWNWSVMERTLPMWRIVKVPGLSVEAGEDFLAPELAHANSRRRLFAVDLSVLPQDFINDDSRQSAFVTVSELPKIAKTRLPARNYIG
jgi:hypothetical protein